jgi:hypothetical protein
MTLGLATSVTLRQATLRNTHPPVALYTIVWNIEPGSAT